MRMLKKFWIVMVAALGVFASAAAAADASYREQMKGLDEQVQEVKSDVLSIAAELARLEERLLYPSNTHLAVFVALAERDTLRLDAVQIQIDGQLVAHSIYSFKELEALQKGGVQRIYTGNVATGEHQIEVTIAGKLDTRQGLQPHGALRVQQGRRAEAARRDARLVAAAARRLVTSMPRATLIVGLGLASALAAGPCAGKDLRDLYFGEALYQREPGTLLRSARAARCGARPAQRRSTSRSATRCTFTSAKPSSRSATSSSTTACIIAPAAPSRRCSKARWTKPCATKRPIASRASTSRRTRRPMR